MGSKCLMGIPGVVVDCTTRKQDGQGWDGNDHHDDEALQDIASNKEW